MKSISYSKRERFEWLAGHWTISPNGSWMVYMESEHPQDGPYSKIYVFDTKNYPNLKNMDNSPSRYQKNNPTAFYCLPLGYFAREMKYEWTADGNSVIMKQGSSHSDSSLSYKLNLNTFELKKNN